MGFESSKMIVANDGINIKLVITCFFRETFADQIIQLAGIQFSTSFGWDAQDHPGFRVTNNGMLIYHCSLEMVLRFKKLMVFFVTNICIPKM